MRRHPCSNLPQALQESLIASASAADRAAATNGPLDEHDEVLEVHMYALKCALLQLATPLILRCALLRLRRLGASSGPGPTGHPPPCSRPWRPARRPPCRRGASTTNTPGRPRVQATSSRWRGSRRSLRPSRSSTDAEAAAVEGRQRLKESLTALAHLELGDSQLRPCQLLAQVAVLLLELRDMVDFLLRVRMAHQLCILVRGTLEFELEGCHTLLEVSRLSICRLPVQLQILHRSRQLTVLLPKRLAVTLIGLEILRLPASSLLVPVGALSLLPPMFHIQAKFFHLLLSLLLRGGEHGGPLLRKAKLLELLLETHLRGLRQLLLELALALLALRQRLRGTRELRFKLAEALLAQRQRLLSGEKAAAEISHLLCPFRAQCLRLPGCRPRLLRGRALSLEVGSQAGSEALALAPLRSELTPVHSAPHQLSGLQARCRFCFCGLHPCDERLPLHQLREAAR
mmetsp:Transcript_35202/g.74991  ORF Transcript_35202/g.74991 Transcript_35202/m.74991 type:complete len:459 (-) Transcript_35202:86-1462(-)